MTSLIRITMVVLTCLAALSNARVTYALAPGTHLREQEIRDLIQRIVGLVAVEGPNLREAIRALEEAQERHPETFSEDFEVLSDLLVKEYLRTDTEPSLKRRTHSYITKFFRMILEEERLSEIHRQAVRFMARYLDIERFLREVKNFEKDILVAQEAGDFQLVKDLAFSLRWTINPNTKRVFLVTPEGTSLAKYQGKVVEGVIAFKKDFMKIKSPNPNLDLKTLEAIFTEYRRQRKERMEFRGLLGKVCSSTLWQEPVAHRRLVRRLGTLDGIANFTDGTLIVNWYSFINLFRTVRVRLKEAEVGEAVRIKVFPTEEGIPVIRVYSQTNEEKLLYEGYYNIKKKRFYTPSVQFRLFFEKDEPPVPWRAVLRPVQSNGSVNVFQRSGSYRNVDAKVGRQYAWVGEGEERRRRIVRIKPEVIRGYKFLVVEDVLNGDELRRFIWDGDGFTSDIFHAWTKGIYKGKLRRKLRLRDRGQGVLSGRERKYLYIELGKEHKYKEVWWEANLFEGENNKEMRLDIYPNDSYELGERLDSRYYREDERFLLSPGYELRRRFWEWDPSKQAPNLLLVEVRSDNKIMLRALGEEESRGQFLIYITSSIVHGYENVLVKFVPWKHEGKLVRGLKIYALDSEGKPTQLIYDRYYEPETDKMIGPKVVNALTSQEQDALQLEAWLWGYVLPPPIIAGHVRDLDGGMKRVSDTMKGLSVRKILESANEENERLIREAKEAQVEARRHLNELMTLQRRDSALAALDRYTGPIERELSRWEARLVNFERVVSRLGFEDFLEELGKREVFYQGKAGVIAGVIKGEGTVKIEVGEEVIRAIEVEGFFQFPPVKIFVPWRSRVSLKAATKEALMDAERKFMRTALRITLQDYTPKYITREEKFQIIREREEIEGRSYNQEWNSL